MSETIRNSKGVLLRRVSCAHCDKVIYKRTGDINRARNRGMSIYCGRKCAGIAKRSNKSLEQRKAEKSAYDRRRLEAHRDEINRKKREAYYARHEKNLKKQAELRAKIRADPQRHEEYKRMARYYANRPEWKEKKRKYDRLYRAVREYGEEWGSVYVALLDLQDAIDEKASWYERRLTMGRLNKAKHRRRAHASQTKTER